ncbi:MAG: fatty acid kinase fatty acid binding subunit [Actinomycetota bacterium]|jgi:DegV family protein with EDD domain|nr:fatty acid kinase fatty acid binding subunit [Actinomycetota bacterium]
MATIRIVTDSSCDLPPELEAKHAIDIVALTVRFGEEEFVDRRDLTPQEFWAKMASSAVLPETAAPAPGAFEEAYRRAAADGCDGVVCIALSAALSATFSSAELAAKSVADVIPVRVIDSRSLTMALGNMCLSAARMAEQGKGLDDVAGAVEDIVERTEIYAALDTLDNLKKGGRIGGAQAMLGSMLSIKPIINVTSGKVEQESKQRTRSKSLRYLADKVRAHPAVENLAIMHGDAPDVDEMLDLLAPVYPRDEIIVGQLGAVIGAHGGPRIMGITFQLPR